jgi:outer membrane biosynthesis protein TonB
MAPNPDQRFQTPQQFGSALSNALQPAAPQPAATPVPAPTTAPPPVQQKSGTNWMGIFLGGVVLVLIFLCAIVVIPKVIDALEEQSGEVVTEPPDDVVAEPTEIQVEIIVPTREPAELPTREPDEQPPEQAPPVDEQPPEQAPPDEDAPSAGQLPAAGDGGSQNGGSQICGSLGFAGGFILLGGVFSFRRKRKF